jgi:hypothetical protein
VSGLDFLSTVITIDCRRYSLDARLKALVGELENQWFGPWKAVLLGTHMDPLIARQLEETVCILDILCAIVKVPRSETRSLHAGQTYPPMGAFICLSVAHTKEFSRIARYDYDPFR